MGEERFTLEEVLALRHPDEHRWAPTSRLIGYRDNDGGTHSIWITDVEGRATRVSSGEGDAPDYDWHPSREWIAFVEKNDLYLADVSGSASDVRQLARTDAREGSPRWSPDGERIAFLRDGDLWLVRPADGFTQHVVLPGKAEAFIRRPFSPDGRLVAALVRDGQQMDLCLADVEAGKVVWRTDTADPEEYHLWLPDGRLYYNVRVDSREVLEHRLLDPESQHEQVILRQEDERGVWFSGPPQVAPDGTRMALLLNHDGWEHLYLLATPPRGEPTKLGEPVGDWQRSWVRSWRPLEQLTSGACEDVAHAYDAPQWTPDGRAIVFASNRDGMLEERHLWAVSVDGPREPRRLTRLPGTSGEARLSPDGRSIAFGHAGPRLPEEIWLAAFDADRLTASEPRRLTTSTPVTFSPEKVVVPLLVRYKSAGDWDIPAWLFLPPDLERALGLPAADEDGIRPAVDPRMLRPVRWDGGRWPAVVWIHGGPMRQMRHGWNPLHSYALFHAFHQYLNHEGYVVLSVNYRSGVGYGKEFLQGTYKTMGVTDLEDCVQGGLYLKSLPFIDPDRVGIWGLSYGGYMTLAALTKRPEVFAMGINVAGIWDYEQWMRWAAERYARPGNFFLARFGGPRRPDTEEIYRQGSPKHFVEGLQRPLINFHGTADRNVDFAQLDRIIEDCLEHGKYHESHYYPGESHVFTWRKTWRDAFPKIKAAFDRHLGPGPR